MRRVPHYLFKTGADESNVTPLWPSFLFPKQKPAQSLIERAMINPVHPWD